MDERNYDVIHDGGVPIKAWTRGVPIEDEAVLQLKNVSKMPFIYRWVAAMPDVHWGLGATVGSVIPTERAIIPAAVGVDIGCGMMATKTSLRAEDLPDGLAGLRAAIETAVPHGRTDNGGRNDRGAWHNLPDPQAAAWKSELAEEWDVIAEKHPKLRRGQTAAHLGTLGTGNHFIEVCLDEDGAVWAMLHSGSRGVGNRVGTYFIALAKEDMRSWFINLPDQDLAYLPEGTQHFADYVQALHWAQRFARLNRRLMMDAVLAAMRTTLGRDFAHGELAVNCHHNYVQREQHFGRSVWVTRKGAVRAGSGEYGIIPGSMGTRSYIVRGLGNPDSFESCSHGAGRKMSRAEAKRRFTIADHIAATSGVECRKDAEVLDETPAAYKDIDSVMEAQRDLVEVVHTLRQVVCVKG
ncbi:MAG: RtcB family protein [Dehalococcoidia bacterium]|nr:RtcB family protein [Dehalococcoidia bacterium]